MVFMKITFISVHRDSSSSYFFFLFVYLDGSHGAVCIFYSIVFYINISHFSGFVNFYKTISSLFVYVDFFLFVFLVMYMSTCNFLFNAGTKTSLKSYGFSRCSSTKIQNDFYGMNLLSKFHFESF